MSFRSYNLYFNNRFFGTRRFGVRPVKTGVIQHNGRWFKIASVDYDSESVYLEVNI